MVCLVFVFWLLGLSITGFVIKTGFTLILRQIFITFITYYILKLFIFMYVFIQSLAIFLKNILFIPFRILSIFIFYCFVFFTIMLLKCIFVKLFHVFTITAISLYILSSRSVSVNVDNDITHTVRLQSNITSLELWIIFPVDFCSYRFGVKEKVIER